MNVPRSGQGPGSPDARMPLEGLMSPGRSRQNCFMTQQNVLHMVLVRWNSPLEQDELDQLTRAVGVLPERIPGILSIGSGPSSSPEGMERGFEWALAITFASETARDEYLPHPDHEPVKDLIGKWAAEVLVYDLNV
ncbi:stress responsive protein [Mycetocola zhujimingii]|uniref:Stress responsive protein n=2 Tax=Mycetocola zhujimingii TaxID=2079792 RepID=A0A2U1TC07_9MICO|nr:stress responsive protein [Mycetocola zhujimingii]